MCSACTAPGGLHGVFVGGFDARAVEAVSGVSRVAALSSLGALVAKSLVIRSSPDSSGSAAGAARFRLLETVKEYAHQRLEQYDEFTVARDALLVEFHRRATVNGRTIVPEIRLGARLQPDLGNLTLAITHAHATGRPVMAGELLLGSIAAFVERAGYAAEALALHERCLDALQTSDPELADYLRSAAIVTMIVLDEWSMARAIAAELETSSLPFVRAVGLVLLGFANQWVDPVGAAACRESASLNVAEARRSHPELNSELADLWLASVTATQAGYAGDLAKASNLAIDVRQRETANDYVTFLSVRSLAMSAAAQIIAGDIDDAIVTVDQLSDLNSAIGVGDDFRVFAHLSRGESKAAADLARLHAHRGASGQVSRECNDSVLLLAALAHGEGEVRRAKDLLMCAGVGRHIGTTILAAHLAEKLGIAGEWAASTRRAYEYTDADPEGVLGVALAMRVLLTEVERRGWTVAR